MTLRPGAVDRRQGQRFNFRELYHRSPDSTKPPTLERVEAEAAGYSKSRLRNWDFALSLNDNASEKRRFPETPLLCLPLSKTACEARHGEL